VCAVCAAERRPRERGLVCAACWADVPVLESPVCDRCGHAERYDGSCPLCPTLPESLRWGRSWCWVPEAPAGPIVHALKYHGWPAVADEIADRMALLGPPPDMPGLAVTLMPVPLAKARERERGFNQSERLATALGRRWQLPVRPAALERLRTTQSQTRLTGPERKANVHGCFAARKGGRFDRLHVVLVDDVMTTGATLAECAAACQAAGARSISFVTFGRARFPGDRPQRR
jgi:ComF family protein